MADKNEKNNVIGIILLIAMFVFFVLFRQLYQKGQKLLDGVHPWDYIALVVIVLLLGIFLWRRSKSQG